MNNVCIQCNKNPIYIQKRGLCARCYYQARNYSKRTKTKPNWVIRHGKELEFVKNYFTHKDWFYHPVIFRLNGCNYEPDFYDATRNTFIEVSGTRQAFHANLEKYKLFIKTFPKINFEVRDIYGELKPLTKRVYTKKQDSVKNIS